MQDIDDFANGLTEKKSTSKSELSRLKAELKKAEKGNLPYEVVGDIMDRIKRLEEEIADPFVAIFYGWQHTEAREFTTEAEMEWWVKEQKKKEKKNFPNRKRFRVLKYQGRRIK